MPYIVFDLETIAEGWSPPAESPNAFPPPWACRVVALGFAEISDSFELVNVGADLNVDERAMLLGFSRFVQTRRTEFSKTKEGGPVLVTFNGRGFDFPVMIARSLRHAVPMPWHLKDENKRKRYAVRAHLDLMDQIADYGAGRYSNLDALAKSIGLPGKSGTTGADVAVLIDRGEVDRVRKYVLEDVAQTALLLVRFRAIQGLIVPGELAATEAKLLGQFHARGILSPSPAAAHAEARERFGDGDGTIPAASEDDFG